MTRDPGRPPLRLVHDGPGEQPRPEPTRIGPVTLALGGGGSHHDEELLWRAVLRDGMRIAYWPFALEPSSYASGLRWIVEGAARIAAVDVELWDDLDARDPADLDEVDLVWVGGGNTYALLDHVRRAGWVDPLRAHVLRGGAFLGDSAGAVLAGADIDIARFADPNDVGITDTTGLDLLHGALVRPHWVDGDPVQRLRAVLATVDRLDAVLAIPENGGLLVVDGTALSTGPAPVTVLHVDGDVRLSPGDRYTLHRPLG